MNCSDSITNVGNVPCGTYYKPQKPYMELEVFTRSCNDELYAMMSEFIPDHVVKHKMTDYNHWTDADRFIRDVIEKAKGWAVIVDEDCFITDFGRVYDEACAMRHLGYTHGGVSDNGYVSHRNLQWYVLNPFFNIIDTAYFRAFNKGELNFDGEKPKKCGNIEPFDDLYLSMMMFGNAKFMDCREHEDGISTIVQDSLGSDIAYHSWYSRSYTEDGSEHRQRIINLYNEAKAKKV